MSISNWLIPYKGGTESGPSKLNLLFQKEKFFIMDNHGAAPWCWLKMMNLGEKYNFYHVDRHYDLLDSRLESEYLNANSIDLSKLSIEEFWELKYEINKEPIMGQSKLFHWANYITIFLKQYPHVFPQLFFATHGEGTVPNWCKIDEVDMQAFLSEFLDNLSPDEEKRKWVLNLDLDYFFRSFDGNYIQILTDDFVLRLCDRIKQVESKIEVITIALSPECCGGWDNSFKIAKIISDYFELGFDLDVD